MTATITRYEKDMTTKEFQHARKYEKLRVDAELISFIELLGDETVPYEFDMYELPDDGFVIEKDFNEEKIRVVASDSKTTILHVETFSNDEVHAHALVIDWKQHSITIHHGAANILFTLANDFCKVLGVEPFTR